MSHDVKMRTIRKSDAAWKEELTDEQYRITRQHGTERAWTGPFLDEKRSGTYACVCCSAPLFRSETKYDSGSGWPSFTAPAAVEAVDERSDDSLLMRRTKVRCAACEAHLGHVFSDGPSSTGLRYCINGAALKLDPDRA